MRRRRRDPVAKRVFLEVDQARITMRGRLMGRTVAIQDKEM